MKSHTNPSLRAMAALMTIAAAGPLGSLRATNRPTRPAWEPRRSIAEQAQAVDAAEAKRERRAARNRRLAGVTPPQ